MTSWVIVLLALSCLTAGVIIGAAVMAVLLMGKITNMQERLDAWEATRWSSLDHP